MLIKLLRTYLRPYTREVALVTLLDLTQSLGSLYLPNLNADIISNGVVKGDIPYIWKTGDRDAGHHGRPRNIAVGSVYWASITSMGVGHESGQEPGASAQRELAPMERSGDRLRSSLGMNLGLAQGRHERGA